MYERNTRGWVKHLDFIFLDILALTAAFFLAYGIRIGAVSLFENPNYRNFYAVILGMHILMGFFFRSYTGIIRRTWSAELKAVCKHTILLMGGILVWIVFTKHTVIYSRLLLLYFAAFSCVFMVIFRTLWKSVIRKKLLTSGKGSEILVVTTDTMASRCIAQLTRDPYQPYEIQGIALLDVKATGQKIGSVCVVADADSLLEYLRSHVVDEVYIQTEVMGEQVNQLARQLLDMGIAVHFDLEAAFEGLPHKQVHTLANRTVVTTSIQTANVLELFLKRTMDICGALVGLLITGIAFIFVAPAIYLHSPGPIFFSQTRVGRNGRQFKIYKFRSMYMDAEKRKQELMAQNEMQGLMFKMENDPRIIKGIGNFIRDTSIDELPQFFNILKGDMSLVGTRPPTLDEFAQYDLHHKVRLSFRPGLTGMWQVSGRSDITDFEEVVRLDEKYIENWDIWLDIKILLKTIVVVLTRKGSR